MTHAGSHATLVRGLALLALATGPAAHAQFNLNSATNYPAGTNPSGTAAGDFDGANGIDLATTVDGPDRVQVLFNTGNGTYAAGPGSPLGASTSPQDIVAGDLNGDQIMDVAVAVRDPQGSVVVMFGNGTGSFSIGGTFVVGDRPRGLSIADLEGDTDLDIAVANRDSNTVSVLTNNGAGSFTVATMPTGTEPRSTTLANFDGDQDLDLAVTNHDARTISIFTNNGGAFSMTATLSVGATVRPDGITSADLNGDNAPDLAVATSDQTLNVNQASVFINNGGTFNGPFDYPTGGSNTSDIAAVDLDCDTAMDLVTSNSDSNNISILRNLGGGTFGPATIMAVGTGPDRLVAADLDGDQDDDIAVANRDSNNVSVVINDSCAAACVGDINGDLVVDVLDLLELLSAWGPCPGCPADINGDNVVDVLDLLALLAAWGPCP